MYYKKALAGVIAVLCLAPALTSAQSVYLSVQAKQQLLSLAQQLVQMLTEIAQAQSYGSAYLATAQFAQQGAAWVSQLTQIRQQVTAIFAASAASPTYPTTGGNCPQLYRDLEPGMFGSDVASLQQYLASNQFAQYASGITNSYDPSVVVAVQRFQSYYGIKNYGDWNTTGYGRIGPATRAMIASLCAQGVYTPSSPFTPYPPLPPPIQATGHSTGTLTTQSISGQGANTVTFLITANANQSCTALTYTLIFGDGQQQTLTFPASCTNQTQSISHTYASLGTYAARLTSGTFQSALSVNVAPPTYTLTLSADQGDVAYSVVITATYAPGTRCDNAEYTLDWGDGSSIPISFIAGTSCATRTRTYSHTYAQGGTYTIQASGAGNTSISFTATLLQAAGAGDQNNVLNIHAEGAHGSTNITDSSVIARSLSVGGNAHIDTSTAKVGNSSIYFDGASYISMGASTDFNFDIASFTENFWFRPHALPSTGSQAALLIQASSQAADATLGGGGLELYGNKLAFVGRIGGTTYHPLYSNTLFSSALTVDVWYHAALVRNGNTMTLYLNGVSQGAIGVSGAANSSGNSLTLGRYGDYNGNYFNGWMDEIQAAKGVARWTSNFDPGSTTSGGTPTCPSAATPTPTVNGTKSVFITADKTCVPAGTDPVVVSWVASNVASCTMAYAYGDGSPGGTYPVSLSGSGPTGMTAVNKTYTLTCDGVSNAVTIQISH